VAPLVGCLEGPFTNNQAEQALKEMGPVAEPAVLALLTNQAKKNQWESAIRILREIGTEKSIPILDAGLRGEVRYRLMCKDALDNIRRRLTMPR
jgi:HEAT repeat protein